MLGLQSVVVSVEFYTGFYHEKTGPNILIYQMNKKAFLLAIVKSELFTRLEKKFAVRMGYFLQNEPTKIW